MKKKINTNNMVDKIYIFLVRISLVSILIGLVLGLTISTITQSVEILNYAQNILPSVLIIIGMYSVVFGVSERPMRKIFTTSKSELKAILFGQIIKLFSNNYSEVFEHGLIARLNGLIAIVIGITILLLMKFV